MQLFKTTHFDFISVRYYAYAFSLTLLVAGMASLILKGGPRYGIDFTGGNLVQIAFEQPVKTESLRGLLESSGYPNADLQMDADNKHVMIRLRKTEKASDKVGQDLYELLRQKWPESVSADPVKAIERSEYVGPAIGRVLAEQAQKAILFATVLIILYVALRFRSWLWGFCSVVAMAHDVLSMVGLFSLLNKEVTVTVVASLLTLAGYSMNDTIVIYDRMRENLRLSRKEPLAEIINRSVNETLSRTVITSSSVLLVLLVLLFFGGDVIHDFAFAMFWGVILGTYSSIFVAAPIIYEWQSRQQRPSAGKRPA